MNLTGAFDLDTARALCAACANTYRVPGDLSTPLCHATITRFGDSSSSGSIPSYTVVAFRGSKSLRDWLTDFEFRRVRNDLGDLVHEGFYRAWLSVREILCNHPSLQHSNTPLLLTGHSLGGALALLAAEGLLHCGFDVRGVYTFGGPRVGDGAWALGYDARLGSKTWRLVDELDLVPRVPFLGFTHAGNRVQLAGAGLAINPPLWQLVARDALQIYRAWKLRRVAQLTDHPITAYTNRLAACQPAQIFCRQGYSEHKEESIARPI
jgi:triacylglycerol lipase